MRRLVRWRARRADRWRQAVAVPHGPRAPRCGQAPMGQNVRHAGPPGSATTVPRPRRGRRRSQAARGRRGRHEGRPGPAPEACDRRGDRRQSATTVPALRDLHAIPRARREASGPPIADRRRSGVRNAAQECRLGCLPDDRRARSRPGDQSADARHAARLRFEKACDVRRADRGSGRPPADEWRAARRWAPVRPEAFHARRADPSRPSPRRSRFRGHEAAQLTISAAIPAR